MVARKRLIVTLYVNCLTGQNRVNLKLFNFKLANSRSVRKFDKKHTF